MDQKKGMSLKYKLLLLLVVLPVVSLSLYLVLATQLFKSDKLAYVYDASTSASHALSSQTRLEIDSVIKLVRPIIEGFNERTAKLDPTSHSILKRDGTVKVISIFRDVSAGNKKNIFEERRDDVDVDVLREFRSQENRLMTQARTYGHGLAILNTQENWVGMSWKGPFFKPSFSNLIVLALFKTDGFSSGFKRVSSYSGFLVDPSGKVIASPDNVSSTLGKGSEKLEDFSGWKFFNEMGKKNIPEGALEVKSPEGVTLLAAYSKVGFAGLTAVTLVRKEMALRAVKVLLWKSILFFIALISFAVITSVFASGKLTSTLRELSSATKEVSEGKFDIHVPVHSNDEVGSLADSFNKMAGEISRLLTETADKARMEKELETAKTVQDTLFPEPKFRLGTFGLKGYYMPASECGGDWWHYCVIEEKIFLWIGDATGHGAPAALLTSAAKSAASVIEKLPAMTPARILSFMNNAIFQTSKGSMLMTFFVASFDKKTGEFIYANASHDPPFWLKYTGKPLAKKDLEPLNEVVGPRLGEEYDFAYTEAKIQLSPGDNVLFYTDGVSDVRDKEGNAWGEKSFIKTALSAVSNSKSEEEAVEKIISDAEAFRQGGALVDDVTLFLCRYDSPSA